MAFNVDTDWIGYMNINGAIDYETEIDKDGTAHKYIKFTNLIYQKKLYNYFRPDLLSERARYFEPEEPMDRYYLFSDGSLNIMEVIRNLPAVYKQEGE